jgi:tryptophan synthase beta subunit
MGTALTGSPVQISAEVQEYFGKYGGFFVPDPFTPALDALTAAYKEAVSKADFEVCYKDAAGALQLEPITLRKAGSVNGATKYVVTSQARQAIIVGYAALGKTLDRALAAGVEIHVEALELASVSKELGLKLGLWLNRALGADEGLIATLKDMGVEVDAEKTSALFDDPTMYAFQRYITNPGANLFVPLKTNVGPSPFPSITGAFAGAFGEALRRAAEETLGAMPAACVAPGFPGSEAVGVLRAMQGGKVRLVTVEPPLEAEREDCYCGAYTRVAEVGGAENVLSPELLAAWEAGTVERVQAPSLQAAMKQLALSGDVVVVEAA